MLQFTSATSEQFDPIKRAFTGSMLIVGIRDWRYVILTFLFIILNLKIMNIRTLATSPLQ